MRRAYVSLPILLTSFILFSGFTKPPKPATRPLGVDSGSTKKTVEKRIQKKTDSVVHAYTELLKYVVPAPDQGETVTCLFVASTGAMEILLNKHHKISHPKPFSKYDLSERYTIQMPIGPVYKTWYENVFLGFNQLGVSVPAVELPFEAWQDPEKTLINWDVWNYPENFESLTRIELPKVDTEELFVRGKKWSTHVLENEDIETVKQALLSKRSPVLINYNDDSYWHIILIVGFDDNKIGDCYGTPAEDCDPKKPGAFYVRDHNGIAIEARSYDWFLTNANAAFSVFEATH